MLGCQGFDSDQIGSMVGLYVGGMALLSWWIERMGRKGEGEGCIVQ